MYVKLHLWKCVFKLRKRLLLAAMNLLRTMLLQLEQSHNSCTRLCYSLLRMKVEPSLGRCLKRRGGDGNWPARAAPARRKYPDAEKPPGGRTHARTHSFSQHTPQPFQDHLFPRELSPCCCFCSHFCRCCSHPRNKHSDDELKGVPSSWCACVRACVFGSIWHARTLMGERERREKILEGERERWREREREVGFFLK